MTSKLSGVTLAAALFALAASSVPVPQAELVQAREAAKQLMVSTRTMLEGQVKEHGPAAALESCSKVALELARAQAREGWRVRRVSLRTRNLADAPDAWERRWLRELQKQHATKPLEPSAEVGEVVRERGRPVLRYLKPIVIPGELCLKCHGGPADIAADTRAAIAARYPADAATGYRTGDLRGAVSITIPLSER